MPVTARTRWYSGISTGTSRNRDNTIALTPALGFEKATCFSYRACDVGCGDAETIMVRAVDADGGSSGPKTFPITVTSPALVSTRSIRVRKARRS